MVNGTLMDDISTTVYPEEDRSEPITDSEYENYEDPEESGQGPIEVDGDHVRKTLKFLLKF